MSKNTNLSFLTDYITADITNGRIGINTPSPAYAFDVTGIARTSTSTYLATASGNVGIGTTSPAGISTYTTLDIRGATGGGIKMGVSASSTPFNLQQAGTDAYLNNVANGAMLLYTNDTERMRILANGNVGIGTSSPGYKLQVNGNGYFGSGLTVEGAMYATSLYVTAAIITYNVVQFAVTNSYSFTPPNMLNSGSENSQMRMYMVWVWGANGPTYGGVRVWMIAVNGGGTAYTVNTILGRDADIGTGLDLARTSTTQLTISSNGAATVKWVGIMQLNTNT